MKLLQYFSTLFSSAVVKMALVASLCLFLNFPFNYYTASAQDTSCGLVWDNVVKLMPDSLPITGILPSIVAQGDTLHICWRPRSLPYTYIFPYIRSCDGGATFSPIIDLLDSSGISFRPSYHRIVANKKMVCILFNLGGFGSPVYMLRSYDRGTTWSGPTPIAITDSITQMQTAAIFGDTLLVSVSDYSHVEYFYVLSTDGGNSWSKPPTSDIEDKENALAISPHYIHRMFGEGGVPPFFSTEILLARSTNLGASWIDTIVVSNADGYASIAPVISARPVDNGNAHLYATWHDKQYGCGGLGCSIVFRKSPDEGQTWDDEIRLTEELNATNSLGKVTQYGERVGAAWESIITFSDDYPTLRYSLDDGDNWFPLCYPAGKIDTIDCGAPGIALSANAIHVVWLQWTDNTSDALSRILYRRGRLPTAVNEEEPQFPNHITLEQNYPNPFNPQTAIGFSIPLEKGDKGGFVTLKVFDITGREIVTLVNEKKEQGKYSVEWNAEKIPSGMYFYRLEIINEKQQKNVLTKKMILIK